MVCFYLIQFKVIVFLDLNIGYDFKLLRYSPFEQELVDARDTASSNGFIIIFALTQDIYVLE